MNNRRKQTTQMKRVTSTAAAPVVKIDPATGMEVITFDDLATYLDVHGLRVVRAEWPRGAPRPIYHVEKKE